MGATVDLNLVLSYVQSKGVTLDSKQKKELENWFYRADKTGRADGEFSDKELSYFISHASKDWKIGSAVEIKKYAANKETRKAQLTQKIQVIDQQIEALKKGKTQTTKELAMGIAEWVVPTLAIATAPFTGPFVLCAEVAGGWALGYAGYELFASDKTKNNDKKIELQNGQIDKQVEALKQERKNLKAQLAALD